MKTSFRALLLALLASGAATTVAADSLTSDEALARVVAQWNSKSSGAHRAPADGAAFTLVAEGPQSARHSYYIYNYARGGFVVASASDNQPAILALVDRGSYDANALPDGFRAWLDEITTYGAAVPKASLAPKAGASVDFLLDDIAWTQEYPMNMNCPTYNYYGYDYPTYAGCVAIAMGQIMRYYQHPQQGTGSIAYKTDTYNFSVNTNLDDHSYDWQKILPNYVYTSPSSAECAEVARLVYDVAAACHMDFSPGASNSQDYRAAKALKENFHYDRSLRIEDHGNYSTAQWAELLRDEIDARRPVYVSGANVKGTEVYGHAFVIDGYNAEGYFHVNWGWNGSSNGYYLLTDLTPKDKQGAGGSSAGYAFMQNAIVGIQPDKGGAETPAVLSLIYDQIWTERDDKGDAIHFYVANPSATDFKGSLALRITDADGSLLNDPATTALKTTCKAGYGGERAWYVDFAGLGSRVGMRFEIVYQRDGETEWQVAGARVGSPHSLVSYKTAGGSIALQPDAAETFQMRLVDLRADSPLTPGSTASFTAKVKNTSDFEYFAPLYLMVYDADGTALIGYTDYRLDLVPAHGEAEVKFQYTLPKTEGSYHFCVAYETLGYNYDYSPMLREGDAAYDYVFTVKKDGGNGGGGSEVDPGDGSIRDYVMECVDYGADAVRRNVKVRFDGKEVYIQGISEEVPDGWAHATLDDAVAVFETPLLLGEWNYYGSKRKQYITGADTNTGDVSGLTLYYDDETHSFTSFSNNWILLTGDPTQVGYYYDHLYNSVSILPANQAGDDRTVSPPDGLATSTYQLKGKHPFSGIPTNYTVNIGFDGRDVYAQGLYPAFPNAWIRGTVEGSTATFKAPQYIGNYHGLYNMYIAGIDPVKEELMALTMDYDAASRTFSSTPDCWFIVQAGETNVMPMMLLDEVTIAPCQTPTADRTLCSIPAGREGDVVDYNFTAINADDNSSVKKSAQVLVDGRDIYVRGISTFFPDVWVKGSTIDGGIVVFPRNQYMGDVSGNDIWLGAGDTMSGEMIYGDFLLVYNPATGELTQPEVNYLAINASLTKVYHLELYKSVRLVPADANGVHSVTAPGASAPVYDLSGRRILHDRFPQRGIIVAQGRKATR